LSCNSQVDTHTHTHTHANFHFDIGAHTKIHLVASLAWLFERSKSRWRTISTMSRDTEWR